MSKKKTDQERADAHQVKILTRAPRRMSFAEGYGGPAERLVKLPDGRQVRMACREDFRGQPHVDGQFSPAEERQYAKSGFAFFDVPEGTKPEDRGDLSQPQT